jgi:transaldolase/glucose-6-phosphate isomerase
MPDSLRALHDCGQSIWLDNIRRSMFSSGELERLIASGLRGMTSNPTIFEKAIGSGSDYDEQLRELIKDEVDPTRIFERLAITDIRHACDLFRPLYDESGGADGFVSLEVSPLLANDTERTIEAAKRLWAEVDRPNVMIKIPGTKAGRAAVAAAIDAGINVNVTLLFSLDSYEAAAEAYLSGLERRAARGEAIERIASVASVFVSRIDTAVDKLLNERIAKGSDVRTLLGKSAVANTKLIYDKFGRLFGGERFAALAAKGAKAQRPLWASTGVKNPQYSDLLYVDELVARNTVNTVPPPTLDAIVERAELECDTISRDLEGARSVIAGLGKANISLFDVTERLEEEGVKAFADSFTGLLNAIESKMRMLSANQPPWTALHLGPAQAAVDAAVAGLASDRLLQRLWRKDGSLWSGDHAERTAIRNALGWLDFPDRVLEDVEDLIVFADEMALLFRHVVVLGMGASSLAPDVLRLTFGTIEGRPQLHVLDSSDPEQIRAVESTIDLGTTLFVVASKSGNTTESDAFFRYFFDRVQKLVGGARAGSHFIAITAPGTDLARDAERHGFRRIFINDPSIGGRYSALSYFGMVPAALAGYDVRILLSRGTGALHANSRTTAESQADAVLFGAAIATLAKAGRNKLTIITHPLVAAFGAWADQLIAESTGKNGAGIIPIDGEPLGAPEDYGDDRVFVYVGAGLPPERHVEGQMDGIAIQTRIDTLAAAGQPVILLGMEDRFDIGEQFAVWEIATAVAGVLMGFNPFDNPDVQIWKDNTRRLLAEFRETGVIAEPPAVRTFEHASLIPLSASADLEFGDTLSSAVGAVLRSAQPHDYIALQAFFPMNHENALALHDLRRSIRNALHVATTVGFGPRFLYATGQLHKGGPPNAVFLQLTCDPIEDVEVPGMVSFKTLETAQALGDFETLDARRRKGLRIHLAQPLQTSLAAFSAAVDDAVSATA